LGCDGIVFLGAIERHELAKHQVQAQIHLFPCTYPELFAISVAECQAVGAYPITPDIGALQTTNQWGTILPGDATDPTWQKMYVNLVIAIALDQDRLKDLQLASIKAARTRFDWERICNDWERLIADQLTG
jgi:glycosyltransferase involved in cell wall biosynthesis